MSKKTHDITEKLNLSNLPNDSLLLALSGGLDSVVLFHLFIAHGILFQAAHINFKLRGKKSDKDQSFVEDLCKKHSIPLHTMVVDVHAYKSKHKVSTQVAAREIRYQWFDQWMKQYNISKLVTAHHLDDQLETFIINLSRGTGGKGLIGIPQHYIARPMSAISKNEIKKYAQENNIKWREDMSNLETKYLRNFIRHRVVPKMKKTHPAFLENFHKSISYLQKDMEVLESHYKEIFEKAIIKKNPREIILDLSYIRHYKEKHHYLYQWFKPYGFNKPEEVEKILTAENGKEIKSRLYRMIVGKNTLLLSPVKEHNPGNSLVLPSLEDFSHLLNWTVNIADVPTPQADASIDFDCLNFPLYYEKCFSGEKFTPLGMKGSKKIGKFLKDLGVNKLEKEDQMVLRNSNKEIIWVVGKRLDDKFKITPRTKNILNIWL